MSMDGSAAATAELNDAEGTFRRRATRMIDRLALNYSYPGPIPKVLSLHKNNVLAVLHDAFQHHNYHRAASAVGALLLAQTVRPSGARLRASSRALLPHLLRAGLHVLHRSPGEASTDQLKRFLRQSQVYEPTVEGAEALLVELCLALVDSGDMQQAYDLLSSLPDKHDEKRDRYSRDAFCGLIRHHQWSQALKTRETDGGYVGEVSMCVLEHNAEAWAGSGRAAGEMWRDAEFHLMRAWTLRRSCPELAYLLVQLYAAAGRLEQAEEVASGFLESAPNDADAHALSLLLLYRRQCANSQAMAEAYVGLLREDPYSEAAVGGLTRLHADSGLGGPLLIEGICLFLDTQGAAPGVNLGSEVSLHAWQVLASEVVAAARSTPAATLHHDPATALGSHPMEWTAFPNAHLDGNQSHMPYSTPSQPSQLPQWVRPPQQPSPATASNRPCPTPGVYGERVDDDWSRIEDLLKDRGSWWRTLFFQEEHVPETLRDDACGLAPLGVWAAKGVIALFALGLENEYSRRVSALIGNEEDTEFIGHFNEAVAVIESGGLAYRGRGFNVLAGLDLTPNDMEL